MITRKDLEMLEKLRNEEAELTQRIEKIDCMPRKIVSDSVKGSSPHFPYTEHTVQVTGLDDSNSYRGRKNTARKLKKLLKDKKYKIHKAILQTEYELNHIDDPEIREIIRLYYYDSMNWKQVMFKMREKYPNKYNSESTARMKLDRFFEKN